MVALTCGAAEAGNCGYIEELRKRAEQAEASAAAMRQALESAEEYLQSNVPGNSYGLLDHDADKERSAALALVREARSSDAGAKMLAEVERLRTDAMVCSECPKMQREEFEAFRAKIARLDKSRRRWARRWCEQDVRFAREYERLFHEAARERDLAMAAADQRKAERDSLRARVATLETAARGAMDVLHSIAKQPDAWNVREEANDAHDALERALLTQPQAVTKQDLLNVARSEANASRRCRNCKHFSVDEDAEPCRRCFDKSHWEQNTATRVIGCVRCACPCALVGEPIPADGLCSDCRKAQPQAAEPKTRKVCANCHQDQHAHDGSPHCLEPRCECQCRDYARAKERQVAEPKEGR